MYNMEYVWCTKNFRKSRKKLRKVKKENSIRQFHLDSPKYFPSHRCYPTWGFYFILCTFYWIWIWIWLHNAQMSRHFFCFSELRAAVFVVAEAKSLNANVKNTKMEWKTQKHTLRYTYNMKSKPLSFAKVKIGIVDWFYFRRKVCNKLISIASFCTIISFLVVFDIRFGPCTFFSHFFSFFAYVWIWFTNRRYTFNSHSSYSLQFFRFVISYFRFLSLFVLSMLLCSFPHYSWPSLARFVSSFYSLNSYFPSYPEFTLKFGLCWSCKTFQHIIFRYFSFIYFFSCFFCVFFSTWFYVNLLICSEFHLFLCIWSNGPRSYIYFFHRKLYCTVIFMLDR